MSGQPRSTAAFPAPAGLSSSCASLPPVLGAAGVGISFSLRERTGDGAAAPQCNPGRSSPELLGQTSFLLLQGKTRQQSRICALSRFKIVRKLSPKYIFLGLNIRLFDKAFLTLLIEMLKHLKHLKLKLYFVFFGDKCITHSPRGKNILKFSRNIVTAEFLSAGTKAVL